MALFHLHVTQVRRSAGQSAIACAAYRAGEKLFSEYCGETNDFTNKGGVICSDIFLPAHSPPEYQDRAVLWNAVENVERSKTAQLAYSFDIFMFSVPSGLLTWTANGALSSGGSIVWTRTGTASWVRTAKPFLTLFPPPTGEARRRWSTGGRCGRAWSTPSLRKRV